MLTTSFTSPAINCGGCARNVKVVLSRTTGVSNVNVDVAAKRVTVTYDSSATSPEQLARALTQAGYAPEPVTAGA